MIVALGKELWGKKIQVIDPDLQVVYESDKTSFINEIRFFSGAIDAYHIILLSNQDTLKQEQIQVSKKMEFLKIESLSNRISIQGNLGEEKEENHRLLVLGKNGIEFKVELPAKQVDFALQIPKNEMEEGIYEVVVLSSKSELILHKKLYILKNDFSIKEEKIDFGISSSIHSRGKLESNYELRPSAKLAWLISDMPEEFPIHNWGTLNFPHIMDSVNQKEAWLTNWLQTSKESMFKYIFDQTPYAIYPEKSAMILYGKIQNKSVEDTILFMSIPNAKEFFYMKIQPNGAFTFPDIRFYGSQDLYVKMGSAVPQIEWIWEEKFPTGIQSLGLLPTPEVNKSWLQGIFDRKSIQENFYYSGIGQEKELNPTKETSLRGFFGKPNYEIDLSKYEEMPTIQDVFVEYLNDARLRRRKGNLQIRLIDKGHINFIEFRNDPLILIDGEPLFDPNLIADINPQEIGIVQILNYKYFIGDFTFDGIISFNSRPGSKIQLTSPNSAMLTLKGYQPSRSFPEVVYSFENRFSQRKPDFRTYLHWQNTAGKKIQRNWNFSFYQSDELGTFRLKLYEVDSYGNLTISYQDYESVFAK